MRTIFIVLNSIVHSTNKNNQGSLLEIQKRQFLKNLKTMTSEKYKKLI